MSYPEPNSRAGFTLLELMVVITIVGLLATVILASLSNSRGAARDATRVQSVKELQKALELYRNANAGNYPCATANPGCSATGAAAGVTINTATPSEVNNAITTFFSPSTETNMIASAPIGMAANTASIVYRVGSTAGNNDSPDRSAYTILVRREQTVGAITAGTWCKINSTGGHSAWASYANCF